MTKIYNLEERTFKFAKNTRETLKQIPIKIIVLNDIKQVLRSSGSIGANYIEANESLSKKDFIMKIKICRKEAKESKYWFNLIIIHDYPGKQQLLELIDEADELTKIFGSILEKSKS